MFSVSLNESMCLNESEHASNIFQSLSVVEELCGRFAQQMTAVLHAMSQHGRHFGVIPNIDALDVANFQSLTSQRAVRHSNLLAHILLSQRSQFLNKLGTLEDVVDDLSDDFSAAIAHLRTELLDAAFSSNLDVPSLWKSLDLSQYDLTTCLRETDVLLKSFLCVLPEDQLAGFDFTIQGLARCRRLRLSASHLNTFPARRIVTVAGE
jgi:hypothetical protein